MADIELASLRIKYTADTTEVKKASDETKSAIKEAEATAKQAAKETAKANVAAAKESEKAAKEAAKVAQQQIEATQEKIKGFGKMALGIGAGLTALLTVNKGIDRYLDQSKIAGQFENTFNRIAVASEATKKSLEDFAETAQKTMGQSAEDIKAADAVLGQLTGSADAVLHLNQALVDMSTALGMDTQSVATLLGKTLTGDLSALSRYGIQITDDIKQQFADAGDDMVKKADIINGLLEAKFGGAAASYGKTAAGQFKAMKESLLDAAAAIGKIVVPILTVLGNTIEIIINNIPLLIGVLGAMGAALIALKGDMIATAIAAMWDGMMELFAANPFAGLAIGAAIVGGLTAVGLGVAKTISNSSGGGGVSGGDIPAPPNVPSPANPNSTKNLGGPQSQSNPGRNGDIAVNVYLKTDKMGNIDTVKRMQNSNQNSNYKRGK